MERFLSTDDRSIFLVAKVTMLERAAAQDSATISELRAHNDELKSALAQAKEIAASDGRLVS